jgi:hypothetical protein
MYFFIMKADFEAQRYEIIATDRADLHVKSTRNHFRRQNPIHHHVVLNMENVVPLAVMGEHPSSFRVNAP